MSMFEILLNFAIWAALVSKSFYEVWKASDEYKDDMAYHLKAGWTALGNKQDVSDSEWSEWKLAVSNGFYKWLIGHVVLSISLTKLSASDKHRGMLLTFYSILSVINNDGWLSLLTILFHCSLLNIVALLSQSVLCVWVLAVGLILSIHFPLSYRYVEYLGVFRRTESPIAEYGVALSLLRSISAALTLCSELGSKESKQSSATSTLQSDVSIAQPNSRDSKASKQPQTSQLPAPADRQNWNLSHCLSNILDILCYVFYLPLFYTGPLIVYNEFCRQFKNPSLPLTKHQLSGILLMAVRVVMWAITLNVIQHYLYVAALMQSPFIVKQMSLWAVAGIGFIQGHFFMLKYFVFWAGFGVLARLDGLNPPGPPGCTSSIYRYSRMWKEFDRGLYGYMFRHIYIPLGGSRCGLVRQLSASFVCFAFVCLWHGLHRHMIVWILLNYIGVTVEALTDRLGRSRFVTELEMHFLSADMKQRLHSFLITPLSAMSHFAIFTFFSTSRVGYTIFYRLVVEGLPTSLLLVCLFEYVLANCCKFCDSVRRTTSRAKKTSQSKIIFMSLK